MNALSKNTPQGRGIIKPGRLLEQLLKLPPRPKLYAAGKISKNDWRRVIIGGLPEVNNCEPEIWDPDLLIDCQTFRYCGPFFVRCDHGCAHRPAGHAAAGCSDDHWLDDDGLHPKVWNVNRARLRSADIVLAYINEVDCFGTLVEIGLAAETSKPIAVGFGRQITDEQVADMWMAAMPALKVYRGSAETVWRSFADDFLTNNKQ